MDRFTLTGKRALVTGGNRGIGFGIAQGLAEVGADLVLLARDMAGLQSAQEKLRQTGRQVEIQQFDLQNTGEIAGMYDTLIQRVGIIDILVNNAGLTRRNPAHELHVQDWKLVMEVNLTAVFALSQAFAKALIQQGKPGSIINIASIQSEVARRENAAYATSKGGVRQLTKALAFDWAQYNIRVNAIGPGFIHTDLTERTWSNPELDQWVKNRTPLGRWGTPEDIAGAAIFLASEAASFMTGQIIYVDGGVLAAL